MLCVLVERHLSGTLTVLSVPRGAAIPLHPLREGLQPEERAAGAHEEAHGGAALPVQLLRHGLHAEEQHEAAHEAGPQLRG